MDRDSEDDGRKTVEKLRSAEKVIIDNKKTTVCLLSIKEACARMNAMGSMEKEISREIRRSKVQRAVLGTIALAGVISVAMVAPNTLQLLRVFDRGMRRKFDPKYAASRAFFRLVDRGYITIEETTQGKRARLSVKGTRALGVLDRPNIRLRKPKRWDGKWRVVIFDIKERRRLTRNRLRDMLKRLGFKRLQDSVWVYPYDREDIIILLKADFKIGSEVLYMIVDRIENDRRLRKHFALS